MWCPSASSDRYVNNTFSQNNNNNNVNNTNTTLDYHTTSTDDTFFFVYDLILWFIAIAVVLVNGAVVVVYCTVKSIRKKTANLLLCDQALVDIFNGSIAGGITLFQEYIPVLWMAGVYQFR